MLVLIHGADPIAARRRLQQLKDEADGGTGMLLTNYSAIDGREATVNDILGPALSPPFLAPRRMVVVERFLERFEAQQGQGQGHARGPKNMEPFAPLIAALMDESLPPTTMLVFTSGLLKKNVMLDHLRKVPGAEVDEHPEMKAGEVIQYIRGEGAARGVRFRAGPAKEPHPESDEWVRYTQADPAALLASLTNGDTLHIANELDKLALYTMGREVTVDAVYELCAGDRTVTGFQFVDAVMDGKHVEALGLLESLLERNEEILGLHGLLLMSYRLLAPTLDLLEDGVSAEEIGRAINRPWPRLRDQVIARARHLGRDGFAQAYEVLVAADRGHKTGEVDGIVAFELMIAKLCALGRPRRPA